MPLQFTFKNVFAMVLFRIQASNGVYNQKPRDDLWGSLNITQFQNCQVKLHVYIPYTSMYLQNLSNYLHQISFSLIFPRIKHKWETVNGGDLPLQRSQKTSSHSQIPQMTAINNRQKHLNHAFRVERERESINLLGMSSRI